MIGDFSCSIWAGCADVPDVRRGFFSSAIRPSGGQTPSRARSPKRQRPFHGGIFRRHFSSTRRAKSGLFRCGDWSRAIRRRNGFPAALIPTTADFIRAADAAARFIRQLPGIHAPAGGPALAVGPLGGRCESGTTHFQAGPFPTGKRTFYRRPGHRGLIAGLPISSWGAGQGPGCRPAFAILLAPHGGSHRKGYPLAVMGPWRFSASGLGCVPLCLGPPCQPRTAAFRATSPGGATKGASDSGRCLISWPFADRGGGAADRRRFKPGRFNSAGFSRILRIRPAKKFLTPRTGHHPVRDLP